MPEGHRTTRSTSRRHFAAVAAATSGATAAPWLTTTAMVTAAGGTGIEADIHTWFESGSSRQATAVDTFTVSDTTGNDTGTIQAAIDAAFANPGRDVVSLGPVVDGCYNLRASDLTDPDQGLNKARALDLKSDLGNELTFDGNDEPICRLLAPIPASDPGNNPAMVWFKAFDTTGVRITELNVDGGAVGNEDPANRTEYLDFLVWFKNSTDLQWTNSFVTNMYGLCGIDSVQSSLFAGITCQNPGRAGLNIQGDSFGNIFRNNTFTSTGDDSIAFNATQGGVPHDNAIEGGTYYQDERTQEGAALAIRGGNNISIEPNATGTRPRFGSNLVHGTSNRASVLVLEEPNSQPIEADAFNISINSADIYYDGSRTSAAFFGPSTHDNSITNSTITYPGCPVYGIWAASGVPLPDGLSTDTFVPDGTCNTHPSP